MCYPTFEVMLRHTIPDARTPTSSQLELSKKRFLMTAHDYLTTQDAEKLIAAAHHAANEVDVSISISVLDAGGNFPAFSRDDRAVLISSETGTRKAFTALQMNASTDELVETTKSTGPFYTLQTALDRTLLFIPDGIPIQREGHPIRALGVGGASPEQDHAIAMAALAVLDG